MDDAPLTPPLTTELRLLVAQASSLTGIDDTQLTPLTTKRISHRQTQTNLRKMRDEMGAGDEAAKALGVVGGTGILACGNDVEAGDEAARTRLAEAYGKLPLYFIENKGQVDEKVRCYEKGSAHSTFFTRDGVYISLTKGDKGAGRSV